MHMNRYAEEESTRRLLKHIFDAKFISDFTLDSARNNKDTFASYALVDVMFGKDWKNIFANHVLNNYLLFFLEAHRGMSKEKFDKLFRSDLKRLKDYHRNKMKLLMGEND